MKRLAVLVVLACVAGCSNAPIAGFLDCVFPSKAGGPRPEKTGDPFPPPDRIPAPDLGAPVGPPGPVVPGGGN